MDVGDANPIEVVSARLDPEILKSLMLLGLHPSIIIIPDWNHDWIPTGECGIESGLGKPGYALSEMLNHQITMTWVLFPERWILSHGPKGYHDTFEPWTMWVSYYLLFDDTHLGHCHGCQSVGRDCRLNTWDSKAQNSILHSFAPGLLEKQ